MSYALPALLVLASFCLPLTFKALILFCEASYNALTALFFDPERTALDSSGAIDRWVRVTKPIEIEAVRFLGLDAAAIRWFFRGWMAAAGLSLIWGLAQLVRRRSVH